MLERHKLYITNIWCNFCDCIAVYGGGVTILHVRRHFSVKYYIFLNNILKEINVL
jgi:NAD kinase